MPATRRQVVGKRATAQKRAPDATASSVGVQWRAGRGSNPFPPIRGLARRAEVRANHSARRERCCRTDCEPTDLRAALSDSAMLDISTFRQRSADCILRAWIEWISLSPARPAATNHLGVRPTPGDRSISRMHCASSPFATNWADHAPQIALAVDARRAILRLARALARQAAREDHEREQARNRTALKTSGDLCSGLDRPSE
jgi:hypothetical protein